MGYPRSYACALSIPCGKPSASPRVIPSEGGRLGVTPQLLTDSTTKGEGVFKTTTYSDLEITDLRNYKKKVVGCFLSSSLIFS